MDQSWQKKEKDRKLRFVVLCSKALPSGLKLFLTSLKKTNAEIKMIILSRNGAHGGKNRQRRETSLIQSKTKPYLTEVFPR